MIEFTRNVEIIDSSVIASILWNHRTMAMRVIFINGSIYDYEAVDSDTFSNIITSSSAGSYFNSIKDYFKAIKVS